MSKLHVEGENRLELTMRADRSGLRRRIAFAVTIIAPLIVLIGAWTASQRDDGVRVLLSRDDLPTPPSSVAVPETPQPVNPATLTNGWYLTVYTQVFTTADEVLLQAAQELAIEASGLGYSGVKIVRDPGSPSECYEDGVCVTGGAPMGYYVLLKGPYPTPNWSQSETDLDAKFEWHQTTQAQEREEATARGLTLRPSLHRFTFS